MSRLRTAWGGRWRGWLGVALGLAPAAFAQGTLRLGDAAGAAVTAKVGTHETTLGLALGGAAPLASGGRHEVYVRPDAGLEALVEDLGIPGARLGAQVGVEVGYAFGTARPYRGAGVHRRPRRTHTLGYYLIAYLDADSTSQLSGGVRYVWAGPRSSVDVQFENDALAHQLLDRYRTFALRVRYLHRGGRVPVGAGLRAVVWTGTTEGLGRLSRDETYDLSEQHGGAYAHGILAVDLYRDGLTLSLGVDSEGIRSTLQNSFHYLIDDGQIPRLEGRRPRLFVRVALNELGGLY